MKARIWENEIILCCDFSLSPSTFSAMARPRRKIRRKWGGTKVTVSWRMGKGRIFFDKTLGEEAEEEDSREGGKEV